MWFTYGAVISPPLPLGSPSADAQLPMVLSPAIQETVNRPFRNDRDMLNLALWRGTYTPLLYHIPWLRFQELCITETSIGQRLQPTPHLSGKVQNLRDLRFGNYHRIPPKLISSFSGSEKSDVSNLLAFCFLLSNNLACWNDKYKLWKWISTEKPIDFCRLLFHPRTTTARAISSQLLQDVVKYADVLDLQFLLDAGMDKLCLSGSEGGRLLKIALDSWKYDIARVLLDHGADVNPPSHRDVVLHVEEFPLFCAARNDRADITKRLLDNGASLHRVAWRTIGTNGDGETTVGRASLEEAVKRNHLSTVRFLLDAGAEIDSAKISQHSVTNSAFLNGNLALYQLLLSYSSAEPRVNVSSIILAARDGIRSLHQYIEDMEIMGKSCPQELLEEALCGAAEYSERHRSAVTVLLDCGVSPNVPAFENIKKTAKYPLDIAVYLRDEDLFTLFLDRGANLLSSTSLCRMAKDPDLLHMLRICLSRNSDVKLAGTSALGAAIINENWAGIQLLVGSGAEVNKEDWEGRLPIHYACESSNLKIVEFLVENGADINSPPNSKHGFTALHWAISSESVDIVRFLIWKEPDIITKCHGSGGPTLLEVCASHQAYWDHDWDDDDEFEDLEWYSTRAEIFKILLENGADINGPQFRTRAHRNSALSELILGKVGDGTTELAIDAGADINWQNYCDGARSPVQAAAEVGNLALVKLLVEKGADINAPAACIEGRTALQAACSQEDANYEVIEFLLDQGAKVNAEAGLQRGLTALQGATIQGHITVALMLLERGADVNAPAALIDGRTALEGAAEHGRLDMVQLLLNAIAVTGRKWDAREDRAVELAKQECHFAVAELLESQSADSMRR